MKGIELVQNEKTFFEITDEEAEFEALCSFEGFVVFYNENDHKYIDTDPVRIYVSKDGKFYITPEEYEKHTWV